MIKLMGVLIISSTYMLYGYGEKDAPHKDPNFLSFLKFEFVLKPNGEKATRIPFSNLENSLREKVILPQSYKGVSITLGLPFQKKPFSTNIDNVDIWIACQPMLNSCGYSKTFENNFIKSWNNNSIGVFARWSRWEWPCFYFAPINYTHLAEVNLSQILHRSTFYNENSLPKEVNRQLFEKAWAHRLQNRESTLGSIHFARTFVFKKPR